MSEMLTANLRSVSGERVDTSSLWEVAGRRFGWFKPEVAPVLPIRPELLDRLHLLRRGDVHRPAVARWARACLEADGTVGDATALRVLVYMAATDLKSPSTHEYLYQPADFEA